MHGTISLKFIDAKQAKEIYHYKNTKRKLYVTLQWSKSDCILLYLVGLLFNFCFSSNHVYTAGNNIVVVLQLLIYLQKQNIPYSWIMDILLVAGYYLCMICDYTAVMGIVFQFGLKNKAIFVTRTILELKLRLFFHDSAILLFAV